jgi:hypothetical protein
VSAYLVLDPFGDDGDLEPHPALVRAQRPTASQVMAAVAVPGAFPAGSYLAGGDRVPAA